MDPNSEEQGRLEETQLFVQYFSTSAGGKSEAKVTENKLKILTNRREVTVETNPVNLVQIRFSSRYILQK